MLSALPSENISEQYPAYGSVLIDYSFKQRHQKPRLSLEQRLCKYRQTSNIRHTWEGNKIVDHSDAVGASPVGAAPTTSSFSTLNLTSMDWARTTARQDENHLSFGIWFVLY